MNKRHKFKPGTACAYNGPGTPARGVLGHYLNSYYCTIILDKPDDKGNLVRSYPIVSVEKLYVWHVKGGNKVVRKRYKPYSYQLGTAFSESFDGEQTFEVVATDKEQALSRVEAMIEDISPFGDEGPSAEELADEKEQDHDR